MHIYHLYIYCICTYIIYTYIIHTYIGKRDLRIHMRYAEREQCIYKKRLTQETCFLETSKQKTYKLVSRWRRLLDRSLVSVCMYVCACAHVHVRACMCSYIVTSTLNLQTLFLRCDAYVTGDLYLYVCMRVCTYVCIETSKCNIYPRILRCATYVKIDLYVRVCMWFSVCVCTCMYCDLVKKATF